MTKEVNMKPILFSTEMIRAILEGRKSQTRRIIKPQPDEDSYYVMEFSGGRLTIDYNQGEGNPVIKCPYPVGTVIYARETWQITDFLHPSDENYGYIYKASENGQDWEKNSEGWKWRPSLFMPKAAARIFLEVTDVRVERLQDITEEDAIAEGIEMNNRPHPGWYWMEDVYSTDSPTYAFEKLWQKINGKKHPWDSNPWIWCYIFKRINTPN